MFSKMCEHVHKHICKHVVKLACILSYLEKLSAEIANLSERTNERTDMKSFFSCFATKNVAPLCASLEPVDLWYSISRAFEDFLGLELNLFEELEFQGPTGPQLLLNPGSLRSPVMLLRSTTEGDSAHLPAPIDISPLTFNPMNV